jgi:N-acetylneuraminate synthase
VIAEVAQSHDGSLGLAHAFIDAVARTGADAIKFQTHIAAAESTPAEPWRVPVGPQDASRYEYWRRMEFSADEWDGLARHAEDAGLVFLSSPFSPEAVELLDRLDGRGMAAWKVASGEVSNLPLLRQMAQTGKPVLLSSGMSPWEELDRAVEAVREAGGPGALAALFQTTSAYPCPPERLGLNVLGEIASRYGCPAGLSDHSGTIFPALAATTLGARAIEVHVTLSREMFGPDVPASVTTAELAELVRGAGFVAEAMAHPVDKDAMAREMEPLRRLFTKSLVLARALPRGTVLERSHLALKKPGTGLPADRLDEVVGRRLARDLPADHLLTTEDLEPSEGDR